MMTHEQIAQAVEDRLCVRWKQLMLDEGAAPICCVGVTQACGRGHVPVICTTEDMPLNMLADFLDGVANLVRREHQRERGR